MIDLHTHFLPGIDDGSQSVEETEEMLRYMAENGVKTVVATPHYYHDIEIEEFVAKRDAAYESIKDLENIPKILLGAEVWLEYGMHKKTDLKKLCIQGTNYMLIEMPYKKWDSWVFDELFKISLKSINIIIAHIDRYTGYAEEAKIAKLLNMGFKLQGNIDCLGGFFSKSPVEKFMKKDMICFVGSDCHNMTNRKPCMAEAAKRISKLYGQDYFERLMKNAKKILKS